MLKIHFLNVGHGDCTIIEHHSGRLTMIDINNGDELDPSTAEELQTMRTRSGLNALLLGSQRYGSTLTLESPQMAELTNPIEFMKANYPGKSLFRYIQSHPDLDHMRGLTALRDEKINIFNFWDTEHEKTPDFQSDWDEETWQRYQELRTGKANATVLHNFRGTRNAFFNEEPAGTPGGDGIEILSPTPELVKESDEADKINNLSYVLMITYKGIKIILGGDAEKEAWDAIVKHYGANLKCNLLKASHHGRDSGFHEEALKLMKPDFTVISVGKKPETDASNKYRQHSTNVWSTRWKGNITLSIDDNGQGTMNSECNQE